MILQHSQDSAAHLDAHRLAFYAAANGVVEARWLVAAAYDRWRVSRGMVQWFGTQMRNINGVTCLIYVDSAATDEQRQEWDVNPIADQILNLLQQREINGVEPTIENLKAEGLYCPPVAW